MTYTTYPYSVFGGSYPSRSRPVSSQVTSNFYPEVDANNRDNAVLHSWPGQVLFGVGAGKDRGLHIMGGTVYRVAGSTLYSVDTIGDHTELGTIEGDARCIFADDGESLFIVAAGDVYQYNSASGALALVTDPDIDGAVAVDFLNSQFIYTKPNLFIISDVGNGASASGLNAAQAESQPDDLVRAYVFDQVVYMFGEYSTEPWYNSGTGSPPFDRIDANIISVGLGAVHSVANNDNFLYWLGDDRQVYQASGGQATRVSNKAVSGIIEQYSTIDDAVGWSVTLQGQNFYVLTFPSANKTWVFPEELGETGWFELSADDEGGKYNCTSYLYNYITGKALVADENSGSLYELNIDAYTNNGERMRRVRTLPPIHGGLIGAPGKRLTMSRFELMAEIGVGTIDGQGENPRIMIEASYDGGRSFAAGSWMRIGRLGETQIRAEWFSLKSFHELVLRVSITDPVSCTLINGAIDAKVSGR